MPESISGALFDHATLYAALHRRKPPLETLRDASRLRCVARAQNMRREPSRINDLHRTHRAPPNDERRNRKTPGSSGADLSVVRHLRHRLTHNFLTMNRLPLCPKKGEISGLVRHPCVGNPHSFSHNPQPTTQSPADDASLRFVRHFRPLLTGNPLAKFHWRSPLPAQRTFGGRTPVGCFLFNAHFRHYPNAEAGVRQSRAGGIHALNSDPAEPGLRTVTPGAGHRSSGASVRLPAAPAYGLQCVCAEPESAPPTSHVAGEKVASSRPPCCLATICSMWCVSSLSI
jgi:hypothetical protein